MFDDLLVARVVLVADQFRWLGMIGRAWVCDAETVQQLGTGVSAQMPGTQQQGREQQAICPQSHISIISKAKDQQCVGLT
jgi:hypothetical protein